MVNNSSFSMLVRVGAMGNIGRFRSSLGLRRGLSVVCRTPRGLEQGEVMGPVESGEFDGTVIRSMTSEDHLLSARLQLHADEAFDACSRLLVDIPNPPALFDVELLFDGQGLYFYFLGEVAAEVDAMTSRLAEAFEAKAQIAKFVETLEAGCGPDCGTEDAAGCGTTGCASCAVADKCKSKTAS
ncbi:MAG: PSP1 C-terminal domain-containing protein [Pirellulaceae bacterium]|nr:hypothetical protein [Planctomycetaceae bacterium]HIM28121.1 hypothetical protein [Planctomycetota bacterium]